MTTFNQREEGFEKKFAHDEELRFKAMARRNKLLGLWAAEKLGLSGAEAEAYAQEVIKADIKEAGEEDVFRKVRGDFDARKVEAFNSARLWLPRHLDKQFLRELQGERLEKRELKSRPGKIGWEWVQSPPNDYGDCCKMLRVVWSLVSENFQQPRPVKEVAA